VPVYSFEGVRPRIARSAYVHPDAVVIGDVELGDEASVWPGAVLRGDHGRIVVGARTSIQDGTIVHTTQDWPTLVGVECVVGHNAHLEGCVVEHRCLIGSMSTVLNRSRVGTGSVVAAAALVTEDLQVPPASMVVGVPGRIRPLVVDKHPGWIDHAMSEYRSLTRRYPQALAPVELESCRVDGGSG
jgi:carbonic anhydrase/acetyltransferase-like protein (isoleucine patch superfamily)